MIADLFDEQPRLALGAGKQESPQSRQDGGSVPLDAPLHKFRFSRRATNIFKNNGIQTVGQLAQISDKGLLELRNLGQTTLREIHRFLKAHRLSGAIRTATSDDAPESFEDLTDDQKSFLSRDVASLDLPVRLQNAFRRLDLRWVGDVILFNRDDLMSISGLGLRSISAFEKQLSERGLHLGATWEDWDPEKQREWASRRTAKLRMENAQRFSDALKEKGARKGDLASTLQALSAYLMGGRNGAIIARLYGWDGGNRCTLEAAGRQFKLTRERVRQLRVLFLDRVKRLETPLDVIEGCRKALDDLPLASRCRTRERLDAHGIELGDLSLPAVASALNMFGSDLDLVAPRSGPLAGWIGSKQGIDAGSKLISHFKKATSRRGCFNIDSLRYGLPGGLRRLIKPETIIDLIDVLDDFEWADREDGWAWHQRATSSRLFNPIRQVLAATATVDIRDLRRAIRRDMHLGGFVPPLKTLQHILRRLLWVHIDGRTVSARAPLAADALSPTKVLVRDVLRDAGRVMGRHAFIRECERRGMNYSTCQVYILRSPLIVLHNSHVVSLVGAEVSPGLIEELTPPGTKGRVLKDHGWTPDGLLWMLIHASPSTALNGLVNLPNGFRKYAQGKFSVDVKTLDGVVEEHGVATITGLMINGLRYALKALGIDAGDHVSIELDPAKSIITVSPVRSESEPCSS